MEKSTSELIELLEEAIYKFPQVLKATNNKAIQSIVDSYLPYSIGIEIECNDLDVFNAENFKKIPNILVVDCDSTEKRFRIPSGLDGLICLYNIYDILPDNCSLNMGSGTHFHVDMTDVYDNITDEFIVENNDWIISELKTWGTAKVLDSNAACSRQRGWVRYANEHKTLEIRIGEMTFDYEIVLKRIIHCCEIVKKLKGQYNPIAQIQRIEEKIKNLSICKSEIETFKNYRNIVKTKIINLYESGVRKSK